MWADVQHSLRDSERPWFGRKTGQAESGMHVLQDVAHAGLLLVRDMTCCCHCQDVRFSRCPHPTSAGAAEQHRLDRCSYKQRLQIPLHRARGREIEHLAPGSGWAAGPMVVVGCEIPSCLLVFAGASQQQGRLRAACSPCPPPRWPSVLSALELLWSPVPRVLLSWGDKSLRRIELMEWAQPSIVPIVL